MSTKFFSSVPYKFLAAVAIIAMMLVALPAQPAHATTITVTNPNDDLTSGNGCSLREAIINANNNGSPYPDCPAGNAMDVITLASGTTYTLSLTGTPSMPQNGDLDITDPAGLIIQASSSTPAIIDGGDIDRVLDIATGAGNLTLDHITVTNGTTTTGSTGGGIDFASSATLTLTNSTVSNNVATSTADCGAGIYNNTAATIVITNSTIEGNTCAGAGSDGGGLFKGAGGTLTITGSTFSNNSVADIGGGMQVAAGTITITNSTFANNTAGQRGGGIQVGGGTATIEFSTFSGNAANGGHFNDGGAIQVNGGSVSILRSILANSTAGRDCDQSLTGTAVITNSLVELNSDCTGTITSTADPGLGLLADNGGPTQTMAITQTSPAFNAAASCNSITTDQRGQTRPGSGLCDLGAYEFQDSTAPTVVSIVRASPNPTNASSVNYTVTFSEAVVNVDMADFALNVSGISGAAVSGVSGSGATYTVTVNTGTGNGTIRLDVPVSATINDLNSNGLAGLPFTGGEVYNKFQIAPGTATLTSPNGTIYTHKPTYTWNAVFDTTWYYLWVNTPSQNGYIQKWYEASAICSGGTCSVTPDAALSAGSHTWWVRTWNPAGYGPWSNSMNFTTSAPGAAGLNSPSGSIGANYTPTYTWNKVTGTEWYYLWVNGPSGNVIKTWYDASLVCGASTCSATPSKTLAGGNYTWWVQTWNHIGFGPWSASMSFSTDPLGAATLVSPSGAIGDTTPTYTWNKVAGATWYYLWVNGPSGNVIKTWYDASLVCGASTCSATPATELGSGNHTWWVQTWNEAGFGPWSSGTSFSLP